MVRITIWAVREVALEMGVRLLGTTTSAGTVEAAIPHFLTETRLSRKQTNPRHHETPPGIWLN